MAQAAAPKPTTPASWRSKYPVHPCADVFPMMSDADIDALSKDIKANGLRDRIVFWNTGEHPKTIVGSFAIGDLNRDYVLLDGRNRLAALERLGKPLTVGYMELLDHAVDPMAYVISRNIRRRHLTKEQQAELIVKTIEAGQGTDRATVARSVKRGAKGHVIGSAKDPTLEKAVVEAKKHDISKRVVQKARAKLQGKTPAPRKPQTPIQTSIPNDVGDLSAPPGSPRWMSAVLVQLQLHLKDQDDIVTGLHEWCEMLRTQREQLRDGDRQVIVERFKAVRDRIGKLYDVLDEAMNELARKAKTA